MRIIDCGSDVCSSDLGGGYAVRLRLRGVGERAAPLAAVAQQRLELRELVRRGDHEDLVDPGVQQRGNGVVDERLVVDVHELLRRGPARRAEAGGPAARQDRSAEHTSELQSLMRISYAVFC